MASHHPTASVPAELAAAPVRRAVARRLPRSYWWVGGYVGVSFATSVVLFVRAFATSGADPGHQRIGSWALAVLLALLVPVHLVVLGACWGFLAVYRAVGVDHFAPLIQATVAVGTVFVLVLLAVRVVLALPPV